MIQDFGTDSRQCTLGRETQRSFSSALSQTIISGWDFTASGNKGVGQLTSFNEGSGSTAFLYDARGNMLSDTTSRRRQ